MWEKNIIFFPPVAWVDSYQLEEGSAELLRDAERGVEEKTRQIFHEFRVPAK